MSEPVIGSALGLLFFQEVPTFIFLVGGALMLLAVYIASFKLK